GMECATSFGVLFLGKATAKMLGRKPVEQVGAGLLTGGRGLPTNLEDAAVQKGKVEIHKPKGSFEELLAELEKPQAEVQVEAAQSAIVELVQIDHPEQLVGQIDRLLKLARDPRPEVRRTALWALGRSREFRTAPTLIAALDDPDLDVYVEARNALRTLSRKVGEFNVEEEPPSKEERAAERAKWRKWWLSVRPYDLRDDPTEAAASRGL
ncbi:MAG TPA: HEAT repeat domain-containing protein, partial [Planctomycetaceae bacterium]|nr:HEAT repeat domain-containing protein [Planctomycetaceae bacterium]